MAQPSVSKFQESDTEDVECWDDGDIQGVDDLHIRNFSTTTVSSNFSSRAPHHRDSLSSHLSNKSDLDDEDDLQFHIPEGDASTSHVIADAKRRGVPIPENVPVSALLGGTIKRLGGRKIQKAIGDDWDDDLELPKAEGLKLRVGNGNEFPESLRQLSTVVTATTPSPASTTSNPSFMERIQAAAKPQLAPSPLDKFKDIDEDFFDDAPTIRVSKNRAPGRSPLFTQEPPRSTPPQSTGSFDEGSPFLTQSPAKKAPAKQVESFDDDLELPENGQLKLSTRRDPPKTPASQSTEDADLDWADGSQGSFSNSQTGARRSGRSNRSSSISARSPSVFSPSLSSCMTAESEDEGLDGLVLPDGPLKFQEALQNRLENASPETIEEKKATVPSVPNDDFFTGIEIGDGDVFDSGKLTLNRNIKHKATRQTSPKRTAMTLTFTNKPVLSTTRIPKPLGPERTRTKLEPVQENPGQAQALRRAKSRLDSHSSQSSASNIPTPNNVSVPSTPSRRGLSSKPSKESLKMESRIEPTTTSAQLLKSKRSMPILGRNPISPTRTQPTSFQRPSSRAGQASRSGQPLRPKTPVERSEPGVATRKPPVPFLPAGSSHMGRPVATKSSRTFHRPTSSENSNESVPASTRSISRASNHPRRQHSPARRDLASDALAKAAASKRQVTKPVRRRAYGDGNELDAFDDLPTSATAEARYRKVPSLNKLPSSPALRKAYSHNVLSSRPPSAIPPPTPTKADGKPLPRFAQGTTASLARKQRAGAVSPEMLRRPPQFNEPAQTLTATYRLNPPPKPQPPRATTKRTPKPQQKPHLIKQLGNSAHESKSVKGMHYNPQLYRWEGNEHVLAPFDVPASPPHQATPAPASKPGLIAHIGFSKGVQVEGGMVFDPHSMRWLKMAGAPRGHSRGQPSSAQSLATEDDDDDPFAGIEDLPDDPKPRASMGAAVTGDAHSDNDDPGWVVGEEFDVGPEFVKRQRTEEAKWRRRMQGWAPALTGQGWAPAGRWALRELVIHEQQLQMQEQERQRQERQRQGLTQGH